MGVVTRDLYSIHCIQRTTRRKRRYAKFEHHVQTTRKDKNPVNKAFEDIALLLHNARIKYRQNLM